MPVLLTKKRLSSLLVPALVLGILVSEVITTPIYTARDLRDMREAAVAEAVQGQSDTAVEKLRALSEIAPSDRLIWGDYLLVLVRANRAGEALALFAAAPQRTLPGYAYPELFTAAVTLGELDLAQQLAVLEIRQSTDRQQLAGERARTLIRAGYVDPAAPAITLTTEPLTAEPATAPEPVPAGTDAQAPTTANNPATEPGITNEQTSDPIQAPAPPEQQLTVTQQPDNANPQQPAIVRAPNEPASTPPAPDITVAIEPNVVEQDIIVSTPADAEAGADADGDADADARLLLAEQARIAVREAELAPAPERVESAERALTALDAYAADLIDNAASETEVRNEKLDRVRALTLANRLEEAAELFEALGEPALLPIFGLLYGADLYVRQGRPEQAQELLDIAVQQDPADRNVLLTRFYLELDRGNFAQARQTLAQLRATSASDADIRNDRLLAAQLAAYSDQLENAQRELEALAAEEPASADVHQRLAQVYRWRGWPRRALGEYNKAAGLTTEPESAQLGAVNAQADMHNFSAARTTLATVAQNTPDHPDLAAALIEQQQRSRWEYSTQLSAGGSSNSPVTGAGAITLDQRLLSAPFADHFRAFAHQRYDWADFSEGSASLNRIGFGLDYRSSVLDTTLELNEGSHGGGLGLNLNGEWHFDDQFSVFGGILTDNTATPLRGLRADIESDSYSLGILYRANESAQTRLGYALSELSDGNDRTSVSLRHQKSWFLSNRRRLSFVAEAYYGNNERNEDVPYYNPGSEKVVAATFAYTSPVWGNTERDWSQRLAIGSGIYDQELFGSSAIWDIEYEQRLRFEPAFEINYGLLYRSRVYSGQREGYGAVIGGLTWRF